MVLQIFCSLSFSFSLHYKVLSRVSGRPLQRPSVLHHAILLFPTIYLFIIHGERAVNTGVSIQLSQISQKITISRLFENTTDSDWVPLGCALWSAVLLAEHQTMVLMLVIKSKLTAGLTSFTFTILTLVLASGNLRYG